VLLNLASNAVKDGHRGGTIRLACHPAADGRAGIVVADDGPGIPADRMARGSSGSTVSAPSTPRCRAPAWGWRCPRA
jgi:two-component sensor histidine kinase